MMKLDTKLEELIKKVIFGWNPTEISRLELLDPDASARLYVRAYFANQLPNNVHSVLAMYFQNTKVPEVGSGASVKADDAYCQLSEFFKSFKIPVPELYLDSRSDNLIIIEDCGSLHLADALAQGTIEAKRKLLKNAVDILLDIQKIPLDCQSLACRREFSKNVFINEMLEFPSYFLPRMTEQKLALLKSEPFFNWLANYIESHPKKVVHRDYHAWNILVQEGNELRVIDFQDSLIGPRCYDLASLLHDRDTDQLVGPELVAEISDRFMITISAPRAELLSVLLQRDLKVAGRFAKLVSLGKPRYEQWIEGTYKRIIRTLEELSNISETAAPCREYLNYLNECSA